MNRDRSHMGYLHCCVRVLLEERVQHRCYVACRSGGNKFECAQSQRLRAVFLDVIALDFPVSCTMCEEAGKEAVSCLLLVERRVLPRHVG